MPLKKSIKPKPSDDSNYVEPLYYKKRSHRDKMPPRLIFIIVGVIVFAAAVGASYLIVKGNKSNKPATHSTSKTSVPAAPTVAATTTPQYVSDGTDLNLTFNYPSSWSVSPPSNDNTSDGTITVTSPLSSMASASGTSATGKIVVQVRPGNMAINELSANAPIEALASTQIAYSAPTANQYSYPYLSYVHFSNGSAKTAGVFEEVIITGGQSFTANESLNASYLSGLDPIITASFYQCTTTACTGSGETPLSITDSTWQSTQIFQQVLTLLESFKLN